MEEGTNGSAGTVPCMAEIINALKIPVGKTYREVIKWKV
jgi:hypothetical protein